MISPILLPNAVKLPVFSLPNLEHAMKTCQTNYVVSVTKSDQDIK